MVKTMLSKPSRDEGTFIVGTGTYEPLHPKGASIELTRSLFEGDVLQIASVRNSQTRRLRKLAGSGSTMEIRSCSMGFMPT